MESLRGDGMPNLPPETVVRVILELLAIAGFLAFVCRASFHPWLIDNATLLGAYRSLVAFIGFPIVMLGGLLAYQDIQARFSHPHVVLMFGAPKSDAVVSAWNVSDVVARDVYWEVGLINIDWQTDPNDIVLPIRTQSATFVKPRSRSGPHAMIGEPRVKQRVRPGDRLVGWASTTCADCPREAYWLYIEQGKEGWSARMDEAAPNIIGVLRLAGEGQRFLDAVMAAVPQSQRLPMAESVYSQDAVPEALRARSLR